jgi:hypothetical protein
MRINLGGKIYHVEGTYSKKGDAVVRADIAKRTKLFASVRVVPREGKYLLCVRGVVRDLTNVTAKSLMRETGEKSGKLCYDRTTGRRK